MKTRTQAQVNAILSTVKQFKADRAEVTEYQSNYRARGSDTPEQEFMSWVVVTSGTLAIKFDPGLVNPRACGVRHATTLYPVQAFNLAKKVRNGNGEVCSAMSVVDLCTKVIADYDESIKQLEGMLVDIEIVSEEK